MTQHLLAIVTPQGPRPFAVFFNAQACEFTRDLIQAALGWQGVCVALGVAA